MDLKLFEKLHGMFSSFTLSASHIGQELGDDIKAGIADIEDFFADPVKVADHLAALLKSKVESSVSVQVVPEVIPVAPEVIPVAPEVIPVASEVIPVAPEVIPVAPVDTIKSSLVIPEGITQEHIDALVNALNLSK